MVSFQDETLDDALARLRGAAQRVLFARRLGGFLPGAVFLAGGLVLLARFAFDVGRLDSLWGLLVVPLAPVLAWFVARRELPEESAMVAWLDQRAGGTGAVLTQYELADSRWARAAIASCQRTGATEGLPEGQYQTAVWGTLPAGLFVALALWFSPPAPTPLLPVGLFDATLSKLAARLAELDAMQLAEPAQLAELSERLQEITASLDDGGLEQAFEALDRFQDDLAKLAEEHADDLAALREAALSALAGSPEELAQALAAAMADPATAELLRAAAEQLAKSGFPEGFPDFGDLGGLGDLSGMDPAALEALGGALSAELAKKLAEMSQAGFLDRKALERALAKRGKPRSLDDLEFRHAPDCDSRSGGL